MHSLDAIHLRLSSLSVFANLREDPAVRALDACLKHRKGPPAKALSHYARFAAQVLSLEGSWTQHLLGLALKDENPYALFLAAGKSVPAQLRQALDAELESLQVLGALTPEMLCPQGIPFAVAGWAVSPVSFREAYHQHMQNLNRLGYGIFAEHRMFLVKDGQLVPVRCPDPVEFDKLTGYERERAAVYANTLALIEGRPAANALLYGDSGTGKSTCVKAVANQLSSQGLRLIELRKDQLEQIPALIDKLYQNPLKFILFIDDLSFSSGNDHFSALKAVLEGSVSCRASNMVIYATSNRRHLVRENFADRQGGEVHLRDTLEETASLSERFGLTVTFLRPDKALYLTIVENYLREMGLAYDQQTALAAESFALSRGGRSARAARQFAENLASAPPSAHQRSENVDHA